MNAPKYEKQTSFYQSSVVEYGNGETEITVYDNPVIRSSNGGKKNLEPDCPFGAVYTEIPEYYEGKENIKETFNKWYNDDKERKEKQKLKNAFQSKKKLQKLAKSLKWEYFVTFTFNPDITDSFSYDECQKKISKWLNNARRKCPNMAYIVVPEQHKSKRWHFHALMSYIDDIGMEFSGHYTKKHQEIYNLASWSFGFTTCIKCDGCNATSNYICKYFTKDMMLELAYKRKYKRSQNLPAPVRSLFAYKFSIVEIPRILFSFGAESAFNIKSKDECYNPYNKYIFERCVV